jgi:16S rRNA U516 pseudouridylate synthase RsuA-like enzyme
VSLNGKILRDPEASVAGQFAEVAVDGKVVQKQEKIYLMLNKPRGIVTTASERKGPGDRLCLAERALRLERIVEQTPALGCACWPPG